MAGVELASAYISIIPTAKGMTGKLRSELGGPAVKAGRDAGEKTGKAFGEKFGETAKEYAAKAGVAASAALAAGFAKDMSIDKGTDKLAASLGLTPEQSKVAGATAARLYTGSFGESLDDVNNAVGSVMSTLGRFSGGEKDIERLTGRALDFASAFDADVNTAVGNAGILLDTGLAKSGDEAFDLLVASTQRVPTAFRDELSEATKEYSQFFAGLGFTGQEAMGVLVEASKGGTYMVDKVGDSIKELTIKTRDGNKDTGKALQSMFGTDQTKRLLADLAAGGPKAKAAFTQIAKGVGSIKDPVKKSQAALALFGTPFEDISGDATKMDEVLDSMAKGSLQNFSGAAEEMGDTLNDNTSTKFEGFKRKIELATASFSGFLGPLGIALPALGGLVTTMQALNLKTLAVTAATKAATVVQAAFNVVMALNPVALVVLTIAALVTGLVIAYNKVDWFKRGVDGAFNGILATVRAVVAAIKTEWEAVDFDASKSSLFGFGVKAPEWVPGVGGKKFGFNTPESFDGGGTIPGPVGAPRLIVAHGGEEVLTPAQQAGGVRSGAGGPMIGTVQVDARGMQDPLEVAEFTGRHVAWRVATMGGQAAVNG